MTLGRRIAELFVAPAEGAPAAHERARARAAATPAPAAITAAAAPACGGP
jgi:hypothetical protein